MFTASFFKPKYLKKKNPVFSEANLYCVSLKIPSEMEVAPLQIELFSRFNYKNIKMHPGFLSLTIKLLK